MTDAKKPESSEAAAKPQDPRSRRKLLKGLAATGGMTVAGNRVTDWQKPLVESVLLPAHALTTGVYELSTRVLYSATTVADGTAVGGQSVALGVFNGGVDQPLDSFFQINEMQATLTFNGAPVSGADLCMTVTETAGASDLDIDEGALAAGATLSLQTGPAGTLTADGPFVVDEDSLQNEPFNLRVRIWECDNPDVAESLIDFSGTLSD